MALPTPGPGRPQHDSYSQPQAGWSLLELVLFVLAVAFLGGLVTLGEMVA